MNVIIAASHGSTQGAQPGTTQGCGDMQSRGEENSEHHTANKSEEDSADFRREAHHTMLLHLSQQQIYPAFSQA